MPLVLSALNFGLFGALAAITAGTFNAAIGFGLFGLLSMLRLRSAAFTIKDVAYTFLALIFGLINGLPDRPIVLLIIVNVGILLVVAVTDNSRGDSPTRVMRLTLEHAYSDPPRSATSSSRSSPSRSPASSSRTSTSSARPRTSRSPTSSTTPGAAPAPSRSTPTAG